MNKKIPTTFEKDFCTQRKEKVAKTDVENFKKCFFTLKKTKNICKKTFVPEKRNKNFCV